MTGVVVYNTRTRRKEEFAPIEVGHVRMYSCGPTVYRPLHIGNLRPYMFADLLRRVLLDFGYRVTHVINITDVGHLFDDSDDGEDKMESEARATGRRVEDIAEEVTAQWRGELRAVNCLDADVYCKATEHIPEQIELVRALEEKGYTYRTSDGIYFDVSKFGRYAEFARLDLDAQSAGERIGGAGEKRGVADFGLWKFSPADQKRQLEWDSPWGRGFPGWHIECSAMSIRYLGQRFDIHTGGVDHIPVHHTNEIAQSEAAFDIHPWVNYWMHNAHWDIAGEKMSKSKRNVRLLSQIEDRGVPALALRYFFLQAVYRQPQSLTYEAIDAAATGLRRLRGHVAEVREETGEGDPERQAPRLERFRAALRDDLNAPRAMAVVWETARDPELPAADRRDLLLAFDELLGLRLGSDVLTDDAEGDPRIDAQLAAREDARARKDFAEADRIREALLAEGIVIEDRPEGPRWRRQ